MITVELNPGLPQKRRAILRPMCGREEVLVNHGERDEVLLLLEKLILESGEDSIKPPETRELSVCDVDRLLATLFLHYFGDQIESRVACLGCQEPFELSFSLRALVDSYNSSLINDGTLGPDDDGIYAMEDGRRFRLPTMRDLESIRGLLPNDAADRLQQQCVVEGKPGSDRESLEQAMASVGPVLDIDLDATCPHCDHQQKVRFEMIRHFGQTLAFERRFLNQEVHQVARAYGWHRSEIMTMTRDDRRAHVRMILAEGSRTPRRTTTF